MKDTLPYYSCDTTKAPDKTDKGRVAFAKKWLLTAVKAMRHKYTLRNFTVVHEEGDNTVYFYLKEKRKKK
jgi:hypothetical protein